MIPKEQYIKDSIIKNQSKLELMQWTFEVKFEKFDEYTEISKTSYSYIARVETKSKYYHAIIYINTDYLAKVTRKEYNEVILHEMLHVYFSDYHDYLYDQMELTEKDEMWLNYHEERFITNITRVLK